LVGSSDNKARSRGRATSPRGRAGTILVVRNGGCPLPTMVLPRPAPTAKCLERGSIKGSPYAHLPFPHSGDDANGGIVRPLLALGKGWRDLGYRNLDA
jgi:hypothetical protein